MKQLLVFFVLLAALIPGHLDPIRISSLKKQEITVTVRGEVNEPGELKLAPYSTVQDALNEAGLKEDADLGALNPNTILSDHDVLDIPAKKSEAEQPLISINTADADTLCTVPGIGPKTAEQIVKYRNENGLFSSLEDLQSVKGIVPSKYEKMKPYLKL